MSNLMVGGGSKPLRLNLGTEAGRELRKHQIIEHDLDVVVLDTLYRFTPEIDHNSMDKIGVVMSGLADIARETNAGIVVVDHVKKGNFSGPASHAAIGSQIKGGAAGVPAFLRKQGKHWILTAESWAGSWDEPLTYGKPEGGAGCIPIRKGKRVEGKVTDEVLVEVFTESNTRTLGQFVEDLSARGCLTGRREERYSKAKKIIEESGRLDLEPGRGRAGHKIRFLRDKRRETSVPESILSSREMEVAKTSGPGL